MAQIPVDAIPPPLHPCICMKTSLSMGPAYKRAARRRPQCGLQGTRMRCQHSHQHTKMRLPTGPSATQPSPLSRARPKGRGAGGKGIAPSFFAQSPSVKKEETMKKVKRATLLFDVFFCCPFFPRPIGGPPSERLHKRKRGLPFFPFFILFAPSRLDGPLSEKRGKR